MGRRADLGFRILPVLEIVGHDTLYLPEEARRARPNPDQPVRAQNAEGTLPLV